MSEFCPLKKPVMILSIGTLKKHVILSILFYTFTSHAFDNCSTVLVIVREAMIPCILLALGGNLVDGKLSS